MIERLVVPILIVGNMYLSTGVSGSAAFDAYMEGFYCVKCIDNNNKYDIDNNNIYRT